MTIYFISDLHLSEFSKKSTDLFLCFMDRYVKKSDSIYILGDLFKSWIGDDALTEYDKSILLVILKASKKPIHIYFMPGNRDFMIGKKAIKMAGLNLLNDPSIININETNILLTHGDIFCISNKTHQIYREILKYKIIKKILLYISIGNRKKIENMLLNKHYEMYIHEKTEDLKIMKEMKLKNTQVIIHGHTHNEKINQLYKENKKYTQIVLSEWNDEACALKISSSCKFKIIKITLQS